MCQRTHAFFKQSLYFFHVRGVQLLGAKNLFPITLYIFHIYHLDILGAGDRISVSVLRTRKAFERHLVLNKASCLLFTRSHEKIRFIYLTRTVVEWGLSVVQWLFLARN